MNSTSIPLFHQVKTLNGHTDSINAIQFSADGKLLATGGDDACLFLFDTKTWKVKKKYQSVAPIRAIVWHPEHPGVLSFGMRNGIINTLQLKVCTI
ncbi:WD40-repeat-containing domain protein [Mycena vulgaris]|nr:WD40-repeat-containing domain protein [Mycena vulgaris]